MTPEEFAVAADVSRETMRQLEAMDRMLIDWSSRHNLIARSTIKSRWTRHYLDSAQIAALLPPDVRTLADLGAGAGFPGLVLAAMLAQKNVQVSLIESTGKKAAFLSSCAQTMDLQNVTVIPARIEEAKLAAPADVITARALARLDKLCGYAHGLAGEKTRYFFPKGQDVEGELTVAAKSWHMEVIRHQSVTNPDAVILEIGSLQRAR